MITKFKIFEDNNNNEQTVLNFMNLWKEYKKPKGLYFDLKDLLSDIIKYLYDNKIKVRFHCKSCSILKHESSKDLYGVWHYIGFNRIHTNIIKGYGCGNYHMDDEFHLSVSLKRDYKTKKELGISKYDSVHHDVDPNYPMVIFGVLPERIQSILNEIEEKSNSEKFGL